MAMVPKRLLVLSLLIWLAAYAGTQRTLEWMQARTDYNCVAIGEYTVQLNRHIDQNQLRDPYFDSRFASPDGLAYLEVLGDGKEFRIVLYHLPTNRLMILIERATYLGRVSWAPDSQYVSFSWNSNDTPDVVDLAVSDLKGHLQHYTTESGRFRVNAWSPDSQWLIVTYDVNRVAYIARHDGTTHIRQLMDEYDPSLDRYGLGDIRWSPDGLYGVAQRFDYIVLFSLQDFTTDAYRFFTDTNAGPNNYPKPDVSWSPDSRRVLLSDSHENAFSARILDVTDEGQLALLSEFDYDLDSVGVFGQPDWLPDSRRVLYRIRQESDWPDTPDIPIYLRIFDTELGSHRTTETRVQAAKLSGDRLAILHNEGQGSLLELTDAAGNNRRQLPIGTIEPRDHISFVWSPNGDTLMVVQQRSYPDWTSRAFFIFDREGRLIRSVGEDHVGYVKLSSIYDTQPFVALLIGERGEFPAFAILNQNTGDILQLPDSLLPTFIPEIMFGISMWEFSATISPDRKTMAIVVRTIEHSPFEVAVYVVDLATDTWHPFRYENRQFKALSWAPDSSRLYLKLWEPYTFTRTIDFVEIVILAADGSQEWNLGHFSGYSTLWPIRWGQCGSLSDLIRPQ